MTISTGVRTEALDRADQRRWLNIVLQRHVKSDSAAASLSSRLDMELQREGLRLVRIPRGIEDLP